MALSRLFTTLNIKTSCRYLLGMNYCSLYHRDVLQFQKTVGSFLPVNGIIYNKKESNHENKGQYLIQRRRMSKLAASLVDVAPTTVQPYLKLLRLDKPIGSWLLFWPCAWSIGLAATPGALPDFYLVSLVGAGAVIMRGAGCIINDLWDRDIDRKVERTKSRPLASGAITPTSAIVFLAGILSAGLAVLLQFNWYSIFLGASSLGLVVTYPICKRFFGWPQLGLGLTFNWGALFGWSAVHGACDFSICVPLYLGCISWTLVYDTVYAFQDKVDDANIGIKSTALTWNKNSKIYLLGFTSTMALLLTTTGILCQQTFPFYLSVGLGTSWLAYRCLILNTDNPVECNNLFGLNSLIGFIIMIGIILGNLKKPKIE